MDEPGLAIISAMTVLQENDKVFIYCGEREPLFLNVKKKVTKKIKESQKMFIIFESESSDTKLGIKVIDNKIQYSKFNMQSGCLKIEKIIYNRTSDEYKDLLHKTITKKLQIKVEITKQIRVLKQNIDIGDINYTIKKAIKAKIQELVVIDKLFTSFYELLSENNPEMNPYFLQKNSNIYTSLIPNKADLLKYKTIKSLEFRPQLDNIINNRFDLTNISPIVADSKKIFRKPNDDYDITIKSGPHSNKIKDSYNINDLQSLYSLPETKLDKEVNMDRNIGDVILRQNIDLNFAKKNGVKNYTEYIHHLYGKDSKSQTIDIYPGYMTTPKEKKVNIEYKSPQLDYYPMDEGKLEQHYYKLTTPNSTTLIRNSSILNKERISRDQKTNSIITTKISKDNVLSLDFTNKISTRKSQSAIYKLEDVYDEAKISNTTQTCNGTNKTGDRFYLGKNFKTSEQLRTQTKPPTKIPIYKGENILVCGFYIHSPNNKKLNIINGPEIYNLNVNSKIYGSLFSNYYTLTDTANNKPNKKTNIKIVSNITQFISTNWNSYNPNYDYYILFGDPAEGDTSLYSDEKWEELQKTAAPSLNNIFTILDSEFKTCASVEDIEKGLNKYHVSIDNLPIHSDISKIKSYLKDNIAHQYTQDTLLKRNHLIYKNQFSMYGELLNLTAEDDVDTVIDTILERYSVTKTKNSVLKTFCTLFIDNYNTGDDIISKIKEFVTNKQPFIYLFKDLPDEDALKLKTYLSEIHYSLPLVRGKTFTTQLIIDLTLSSITIKDNKTRSYFKLILKLINLYQIKTVITNQEKRLLKKDPTIAENTLEGHVSRLEKAIKLDKDKYDAMRKEEISFLEKCKGVRICKKYSTILKVNKDNGRVAYKDLEFDTLYNDLTTFLKLLPGSTNLSQYSGFPTVSDKVNGQFTDKLNDIYIYLDITNITNKVSDTISTYNFLKSKSAPEIQHILDVLEEADDGGRKKFYNMKVGDHVFKNPVHPEEIALLDSFRGAYLFKRNASTWHIIELDEFSSIRKVFIKNDPNVLDLSIDDLDILFKKDRYISEKMELKDDISELDEDDMLNCVDIEGVKIPIKLYKLINNVKSKEKLLDYLKLIETYKKTVNSDIESNIDTIETQLNIFKIHKTRYNNKLLGHLSDKDSISSVKIPKSILLKYQEIYSTPEFDDRMQKLINFVDKYGIDFNIYEGVDTTDPEADSSTSKYWYYNSNIFEMPICCKHDVEFRSYIYKDNATKATELQRIKDKYGTKLGESYICKLCGKPIDLIEFSAFEGFTRDNKVITLREAVSTYKDKEEKEKDGILSQIDYSKIKPEILAFKYILSKLGVELEEDDLDYIISTLNLKSNQDLFLEFINKQYLSLAMIKTFVFIKYLKKERMGGKKKKSKSKSKDKKSKKDKSKSKKDKSKSKKDKSKSKKKKKSIGGGNDGIYLDKYESMDGGGIMDSEVDRFIETIDKKTGESAIEGEITNIPLNIKTEVESLFKAMILKEIETYNKGAKQQIPTDPEHLMTRIKDIIILSEKSSDSIVSILLANVRKLFNIYAQSQNILTIITHLVVILQYQYEPTYVINPFMSSKYPALREGKGGYLIKNLFYAREYIIKTILDIIEKGSNEPTGDNPGFKYIKLLLSKILGIGRTFGDLKTITDKRIKKKIYFMNNMSVFEKSISSSSKNSEIIRKLKELILDKITISCSNILQADSKIKTLKHERIKYNKQIKALDDNIYGWTEFLPKLNIDKIKEVNLTSVFSKIDSGHMRNKLNEYLSRLSNNYMYLINKIMNMQDSAVYSFKSYTASVAFNNIQKNFRDYFNIDFFKSHSEMYPKHIASQSDEFDEYIERLGKIFKYMDIITDTLRYKRGKFAQPMFLIVNNNVSSRNLQEYTDFNSLYIGKDRSFLLSKLTILYTTYIIKDRHLIVDNTEFITDKRNFVSIQDPYADIIQTLKYDVDLVKKLDTKSKLKRYYKKLLKAKLINRNIQPEKADTVITFIQDFLFDINSPEFAIESSHEGVYYIDLESGDLKYKLEKQLQSLCADLDDKGLLSMINIIENKIKEPIETVLTEDRELLEIGNIYFELMTKLQNIKSKKDLSSPLLDELSDEEEPTPPTANTGELLGISTKQFKSLEEVLGDFNTRYTFNTGSDEMVTYILIDIKRMEGDELITGQDTKWSSFYKRFFLLENMQNVDPFDRIFSSYYENIKEDLTIQLPLGIEGGINFHELETDFYKNKMEITKLNTTLHFYLYLLRILCYKSLSICSHYKNNIMKYSFSEEDDSIMKPTTSFNREELRNIVDIYKNRYSKENELRELSADEKQNLIQVDSIYNRISVIINLLDSGSLLNSPISFSTTSYTEPIVEQIHSNILIVVDIINKLIFILTEILQSTVGKKYLYSILNFFLEEADSMLETYKTSEEDISRYMNIKINKENQRRKKAFDKKAEEDQLTHKLFRRFNLGNLLDIGTETEDEEDVVDDTEADNEAYDLENDNLDT